MSEPAPLVWKSQGKHGNKVIEPGSIILLSSGTEDSVTFPKSASSILLNVEPRALARVAPDQGTALALELVNEWGIRDRQIEYILRALEADLEAGLPSGGLFGQSLLCALFVHLWRRHSVVPLKTVGRRYGLPKIRLNRVLDYVEANLDSEITLATLEETAGMSPHYFSQMFKHSMAISPHQYVLRKRIERARKLLHEPRISVFEAGLRSGFSEQSHFTKMFRRIIGVTPTAYRSGL